MDTQEAILTRRTIHCYVPGPLSEDALQAALAAAHAAPNHKLTVPWRFTVVGAETRARLAEVGVAVKSAKRELNAEAQAKVRAKITDPSGCLVVSQVLHQDPFVRNEDYAAVACAIQNLMLSLHANGLGSKWSSGGVTRAPETYALLGIDAARERIVGFVWVGTPAKVPDPGRPLSLEQVVRRLP